MQFMEGVQLIGNGKDWKWNISIFCKRMEQKYSKKNSLCCVGFFSSKYSSVAKNLK